jgi:hypothetical protein
MRKSCRMRNKHRGNRHGFVTPTVAGVSFVSKMADEDIVRSPPDRPWSGRILGDWHRGQEDRGRRRRHPRPAGSGHSPRQRHLDRRRLRLPTGSRELSDGLRVAKFCGPLSRPRFLLVGPAVRPPAQMSEINNLRVRQSALKLLKEHPYWANVTIACQPRCPNELPPAFPSTLGARGNRCWDSGQPQRAVGAAPIPPTCRGRR